MFSSVLASGQYAGHVGTNEVSVSNLDGVPEGTYILEVSAGDQHYFKKIVKIQ